MHAYPSPSYGKIAIGYLETIHSRENSEGMAAKNSRELKLMATATYDAFTRNPIHLPTSLNFRMMSHKKAIIHLKRCIMGCQHELFLKLREGKGSEDGGSVRFHWGACFETDILEILLHCLLFSSLISKIHPNSYLNKHT